MYIYIIYLNICIDALFLVLLFVKYNNNDIQCYESCGSELVFSILVFSCGGVSMILSRLTTGASNVSEMKKDSKNDATALPKYRIIWKTNSYSMNGLATFSDTRFRFFVIGRSDRCDKRVPTLFFGPNLTAVNYVTIFDHGVGRYVQWLQSHAIRTTQ